MKITKIILAGVVSTALAATALAHGGATGIVKERMDAMVLMSGGIKAMMPIIQRKADFDAATVKAAAEEIERHAGQSLTKLFPENTGGGFSDATDAVWSDWEEFNALSDQLAHLSKGLSLAAENGLGDGSVMIPEGDVTLEELAELPVDVVFKMVAKSCSACHGKFRVKKN